MALLSKRLITHIELKVFKIIPSFFSPLFTVWKYLSCSLTNVIISANTIQINSDDILHVERMLLLFVTCVMSNFTFKKCYDYDYNIVISFCLPQREV
jgi:hypothetical protein